jgi:hypothetical protein
VDVVGDVTEVEDGDVVVVAVVGGLRVRATVTAATTMITTTTTTATVADLLRPLCEPSVNIVF